MHGWQFNIKHSANAGFGFKIQIAFVRFNQFFGDGQTNTTAGFFGRKIQIKNMIPDIFRYSGAVIPYRHNHKSVAELGAQRQFAAAFHGVESI